MDLAKLISENVAPAGATHIGIFDTGNHLLAKAPVPASMLAPASGTKLTTVLIISDSHLGKSADPDEQSDVRRALRFGNGNADDGTEASAPESRGNGPGLSDFIVHCGDVSDGNTQAQLEEYADLVVTYSPQTPVYTCVGNHDCIGGGPRADWETIIGTPQNFVRTHADNPAIAADDVYIFVGIQCYSPSDIAERGLFSKATMLWLYDVLEQYRNKRCFVFEHVRPTLGSGNAYGIYNYDLWRTTDETTIMFEELMNHYRNVVFFHGHSHLRLQFQDGSKATASYANFSRVVPASTTRPAQNFASVHVPSVSCIRQSVNGMAAGGMAYLYYGSEGYLMEVYPTYVILRGRDFNGYNSGTFAQGELIPTTYGDPAWIPQAFYRIDTPLVTVEEGTFTTATSILDGE